MKEITRRAIEAFQHGLDVLFEKRWFRLYGNFLCIVALVIAKYGIGLTWWQVFVGWIAYGVWNSGSHLLKAYVEKPKFQRIQFRIGITNLADALVDAGIYSKDEVGQHASELYKTLGKASTGYITFTWLERDLFFMNDDSRFSEFAESTISLIPFDNRALEGNTKYAMPDCIELRGKGDAYELVLIKSENRRGWIDPEGPTVTLISIPYEFLRNLQEPGKGYKWVWGALKRQREILESTGLEYWQDAEVPSAWDYRGKYANLHWWNLSEVD
jgi:hypothetical protein